MTDYEAPGPIVHVAVTTPAFAAPSFIIERGGRYYVTTAVLEYDPDARDLTPEQREGVAQIAELYRGGQKGAVGAVELVARGGGRPMNTGPKNTQGP